MIGVYPYSDQAAMSVLQRLDPMDHIEAELIRGQQITHLQLFAEWRAAQAHGVASWVIGTDQGRDTPSGSAVPFAVLAIGNTGQAGVAQAAFLARSHKLFGRALARAAIKIRDEMPRWCEDLGIHRIEARCWSEHPTAARFLTHCGFRRECNMPGFGADGAVTFSQFAWSNRR